MPLVRNGETASDIHRRTGMAAELLQFEDKLEDGY